MRKASMTLSVFVLLAMLLTACGGQQNNTTIPATNVPPVTVESTATSAPEMTTTPEGGNLTTTPGVPVTGAENPSRLSNELKFSVVDQSGNKLADVSDMVLDLDNTRVSYVVVGSGGALNIGDKSVLIPWDSLTLQTASSSTSATAAQNAFVLQADPQVLQNAPTVDLNSIIPAMGQAAGNWDADIQSYWLSGGSTAASTPAAGAGTTTVNTPSVSATRTGTATSGTGGVAVSTATSTAGTGGTAISTAPSTTGAGTGTGLGVGQTLPVQGVALASQVLGSTISLSPGQGKGVGQGQEAATAVATSSTGGTASATSTPAANATATSTTGSAGTAVSTATSTMGGAGAGTGNPGTGIGNLQATIDDMIIETNTGMIQYLVVRTSFGSGDGLIPIPLNIVQWDTINKAFVLNTSPGMLQTAPSFAEDQFPDTTTSGWDQQFSTFWQSNGGTGTGATATATP